MNTRKGYFLMAGSVVLLALMSALVRAVPAIDSTTTTFIRFVVGLSILGALALTNRIKLNFHRFPLLILLGLTGGLAVFLMFLSIVKIGVGKATIYVYAYPIFASILSIYVFKEKIKALQWGFILFAFAGIILLSAKEGINLSNISKYDLLALASAVLTAISVIILKKLREQNASTSIFFSQSLIGCCLFIFPANINSSPAPLSAVIILVLIGIVAAAGQLIMIEGYKFVRVSKGSIMHMMIPVLNIFIGFLVFNEWFTPQEILGAGMVIIGCIGVIGTKESTQLKGSVQTSKTIKYSP